MIMVEDKEKEVRSICPPSSDYATIVPIKKRRFPNIEPPSPPHEDQCPILKRNEKQQESISVSQGSAISNISTEEGKPEKSANASANQDKSEPLSVQPALTNRENSFDHSIFLMKSESDISDLCTNRSNWDLNTTMDAWEGSGGDTMPIRSDYLHGTATASGDRVDTKTLESPSEMAGVDAFEEQSAAVQRSAEVGAASSVPSTNTQEHEDPLKLGLQMPSPSNFGRESPHLSPGIDPKQIFSRVSSAGSSSIVPPVTVKSEPYEEAQKQACLGTASGDLGSLVEKVVKRETVDKVGLCSSLKLFNPSSVKAEPTYEAMAVTLTTNEETLNRLEQISQGMVLESCSKVTEPLPVNFPVVDESQTTYEATAVTLTTNEETSNRLEQISQGMVLESCSKVTEPLPVNFPVVDESQTTYEAMTVTLRTNEETSNRLEQISQGMVLESCNKVTEPLPVNFPVVDESQTISNRLEDGRLDKEDTEYEDGEVQDRIVADGPAGPMDATPVEHVSKSEVESENMELAGNLSNQCADSSLQNEEDNEMQLCSVMEETLLDEKSQMSFGFETHLQDLSDAEVDSEPNETETFAQGTDIMTADENPIITDNARISAEATISDHEGAGAFAKDDYAVKTENNVSHDDAEKNDSSLPKAQSSINSEDAGRDSNTESNGSRIINLSATCIMSSSGKSNSAPDRSAPLHDGRKKLPNVALEGDKLHLRGRNEVGHADFHRFSRERNRDMFSRSSRSGFAHNRGRVPSNMCSDWESEQDFGSEMHNGQLEFHAARHRHNSEYRNYNVSPEDGFVGTGRGGRKLLTDNLPNFHVRHSMRRARGGRHGPPMVGRLQRNMSPSRSISMDDSELVGVRHGFVRQERNIGPFSGNGLHRIRSKSPVRLRSRSPIQWCSPRRRSPEGFVRHPEVTPIRSPPMFRRERMGSPDRACYRGEVMMRRQNSPPYMSRELDDMREMSSGRDRGFYRPIMHNGNSSIRGSLRTRRYDMVNFRERTHGEHFRVPMRGARFHELSGDENTDERSWLNEKRGPVRHFRPSCVSENKGFTYSSDDGSRSYRLCPEDDYVYHEGGNSRERQRERHLKKESGDTHKLRKIEDQEGSFGQGVSDEFDDMPRHKRERF